MDELETPRLRLRAWRDEDRTPFAVLNADPVVMEHFPRPATRDESDALIDRLIEHHRSHAFTFWATELRASGRFIGFVGLGRTAIEAHFTPCVEVGWRLASDAWGHGYAAEAARASCRAGFERYGLTEIVAFTTTTNRRSQRVMERIGMTRDARDDFDHPRVPEGHPLRRHVLYRVRAESGVTDLLRRSR